MIVLEVESPEQLWKKLGDIFYGPMYHELIDYSIAERRFFSFNNVLTVTNWIKGWDNPYLFKIIGYSDIGTKMKILSTTYLNQEKWDEFKQIVRLHMQASNGRGIKTFGVNFNLKPQGKGGCLSSFHLVQRDKSVDIIIHMKVAELPRKFVADLRFVSALISDLDLPQETYNVTFMLSSLYFSIIGLRAYLPILGQRNMDFHGLPIEEPRNYQVGVQEGILKARKELMKEWGNKILTTGIDIGFIEDKRTICKQEYLANITT